MSLCHGKETWQGSLNGAFQHICIEDDRPLGQIASKGYKKLTSKNYDIMTNHSKLSNSKWYCTFPHG
jgi:hypothetical protein